MQQDHPQTSGRLPERHRLRRRYGEPRGVPFIRSGKGSAAAKRGRSDPFRLRAAHGRKRRAYSKKKAAPDPALPCLLESRPTRRGDFQPSRKREGNRRLLLLRQYRRSCQNILAKHGRLARLLQSGRPRTPRDRNCGIYRRP